MVNLRIQLPEGFLNEEERWGYVISSEMKEVWAVELDLFAEFDRVCKKHDIKYIASGGTMLGAVRHKGFIPWDDDMDLMMTRDEYNKLCEVGPNEFKHPYFFQTSKTDSGYMRAYAKLRNSDTAAILYSHRNRGFKFNQGIFIDIFPLDNIPSSHMIQYIQLQKIKYYTKKIVWASYYNNHYNIEKPSNLYFLIQKFDPLISRISPSFMDIDYNSMKLDKICENCNKKKAIFASLLTFQPDKRIHDIKISDLKNTIETDFEFLKMPIPQNYNDHLSRKYGDYMVPLCTGGYHGEIHFNTNKSYKEYI